MDTELLTLLKQILYQQDYMNKRLDKIKNKVERINYQTAHLTKFTGEMELEPDASENDLHYYDESASKNGCNIDG